MFFNTLCKSSSCLPDVWLGTIRTRNLVNNSCLLVSWDRVLRVKQDLSTSVFRKSTHIDWYLHFNSQHPQSYKQSVVRILFSRAESLSSCPSLKFIKELHVSKALQDNCYSEKLIHSTRLPRTCPTSSPETGGLTTLTLPYLKGQSEAIWRVLQPLNVRTFFRPTRTLTIRNRHLVCWGECRGMEFDCSVQFHT